MKGIKEGNWEGKKVLLRLDLDVPIKDGKVLDNTRLLAAKDTVNYLSHKVSNLVICGKIGRPEGHEEGLSTRIILAELESVFGFEIGFNSNYWVENFNTKFLLLENLRFWKEDEENSLEFARKMALGFDCFVNDSFATAHRVAASSVAITGLLDSYAGLRMEAEIEHLSRLVNYPNRPLVSIIGGAKIETKLPVINALSKISDKVLVGGLLPKEILEKNISLESNVIVGELIESGMDVTLESVTGFEKIIDTAKEIVWNGPIGNFEQELYSAGTRTLIEILMRCNAKITVGGGDTISALNQFGDISKVDWVSLGGGAMLDFIAGVKMPGIEALEIVIES